MATVAWSVAIEDMGSADSYVLDTVNIQVGATDPLEPSSPASCQLTLLNFPTEPTALVGKELTVYLTLNGVEHGVFSGRIQSVFASIVDEFESQMVEIQAASALSLITNYVADPDNPIETEYERATRLAERLWGGPAWSALPSSMTWDEWESYDYPTTWGGFTSVSWWVPHLYVPSPDTSSTLEASNADSTVGQLLDDMAMGCSGWYGENFSGLTPEIWYNSRVDVNTRTYRTLDISDAALRFTDVSNLGLQDIYNDVTYANSTSSVSSVAMDSWNLYGQRTVTMTSPLASDLDLLTQASNRAAALSVNIPGLRGLTLDYGKLYDSYPAEITRLTTLDLPACWALQGVPAVFGGDGDYQVRGLQYRGDASTCLVDWVMAPRELYDTLTMWRAVTPTTTWATYPATTTWSNAL